VGWGRWCCRRWILTCTSLASAHRLLGTGKARRGGGVCVCVWGGGYTLGLLMAGCWGTAGDGWMAHLWHQPGIHVCPESISSQATEYRWRTAVIAGDAVVIGF
jgi:hypothetical protein